MSDNDEPDSDEIVCSEALALLRQEADLTPGFLDINSTPTGKIEKACKRVYKSCRQTFLAQYDWGFARVTPEGDEPESTLRVVDVVGTKTTYTVDVDVKDWPPTARAAFVAMLACVLCIPVSGRQEDLKAMDALFAQRITAARMADLRDGCPRNGLAYEVISLLNLDSSVKSAEQVDGVFACLRRMESIEESAAKEILSQHYWRFAWESASFDGTIPQDCVRVEAVETADGRRLGWSVRGGSIAVEGEGAADIVYTKYVEPDDWPALARAALVALVAHKAAIRCGLGADAAKALATLYVERLAQARAADLNEDASGSAIVREVKAVLKSEWSAADANLDESAAALAARIGELLEPCRREVMDSHRWNFARAAMRVAAAPGPRGEWTLMRPAECVRVEAVKTPWGDLCDWSMRGDLIVSRDPVGEIVYIRDVEDIDEWPPAVRRALVYRIAADASLVCAAKDAAHPDASALMALYSRKLSDAALHDAREGNPGRAAFAHGTFSAAFRSVRPQPAWRRRHG